MKIGDKYTWKTIIGIPGDTWIWEIYTEDIFNSRWGIQHISDSGNITSMWVDYTDLDKVFNKLSKDEDYSSLGGSEIDWSHTLPEGIKQECIHEWKIYHGLIFSDEFCIKCKVKRPLENK